MPPGGATIDDLPPWARALLREARVAHLGLLDVERRPRVLPITFAVLGASVWTAVDDKPKRRTGEAIARVRWIRAEPASAITVHHYDDDWSQLAWVQLLGTAEVLDVAGHDDVAAALARRYRQYRECAPRGPLLRLTPHRLLWWRATDGESGSSPRPGAGEGGMGRER